VARPTLTLLLAFATVPGAAAAEPAGRPNIVFILADDLRWNALGCMGDPIVKTPNIDRLAERGTLFRNAFVTTSICAVSRATLFSGQYARRHGINDFVTPFTAAAWAQTYPALLRAAGYRTGFVGKFGVGDQKAIEAMAKEFDYWRGLPGQAGLFFARNDPTRTHATARFGEQALEFLRGCPPGQPFCLSVSFSAPHARDNQPREYPPDLRDEGLYADATVPVPKLATDAAFKRLPEVAQKSEGRRRWERRFTTPESFQRIVKDYYRLITGLDREVGRIVAALTERGVAENTAIVFTSDNGYFLGERGMADKWLPYEESIRVPLIVADPRTPPEARGRKVDALALNIDVAPTFLDLAGLPVPAGMQGRSLVPLVRAGAPPADWRTEFFYEHLALTHIIPPTEGVRTERWMYFRWLSTNPVIEELYDVRADPLEEHDLAADPAHARTLAELRGRWAALREQVK
jgi:arylsulfatase A-like enzyme